MDEWQPVRDRRQHDHDEAAVDDEAAFISPSSSLPETDSLPPPAHPIFRLITYSLNTSSSMYSFIARRIKFKVADNDNSMPTWNNASLAKPTWNNFRALGLDYLLRFIYNLK